MGETASEQEMQEIGSKLPELTNSQRHELIVAGAKSKSRAVRYEISNMINTEPDNKRYLKIMLDLAEHDPDADVRSAALGRVSSIDPEKALPLRRKLIADKDAWVRLYSLAGLITSPDLADAHAVEAALKNDHLFVRIGLIKGLIFANKPFDKSIVLEGLTVDEGWFEHNPIISTGYMSRNTSRKQYGLYIVRLIREDALYALGLKGEPADIPHLEQVIAKEESMGDKDSFAIRARVVIREIQLRQLSAEQQLEYLTIKLRDAQTGVRSWAVEKLCKVKGGLTLIDELAKDSNHPAHKRAKNMRFYCSYHASQ